MVIERNGAANISPKMDRNGRLVWDVPKGQWTVMRFGHTCTGVENAPAPKTGRGLECDKLSKEAAEGDFHGLMGKVIEDNQIALAGRRSRTMVSTHIDSWEVGSQNWTPKFREEFQRLRVMTRCPSSRDGRPCGR